MVNYLSFLSWQASMVERGVAAVLPLPALGTWRDVVPELRWKDSLARTIMEEDHPPEEMGVRVGSGTG